MSEIEPKLEAHKHHEKLVDSEHHKNIEETIHAKAEKARVERGAENLKLLHEMAKKQAETRHKTPIEDIQDQEPDELIGMQQSLKTTAYDRTLQSVRQRLPKQAQLFSKVAHNKTVEAISNVSAKTVARPSGLLVGSIFAFVGSLLLLYFSKHYGFTYNYALFMLLFICGFLLGAVIELIIWSLYRTKNGRY
jgi:hypothetical protein